MTLRNKPFTHGSEDKALLIAHHRRLGLAAREALEIAFIQHPGELAALMLDRDASERLLAARISQPLMLGANTQESFVATSALAFAAGPVAWTATLPTLCTAEIRADGMEIHPLLPAPGKVADILPWKEGEILMENLLQTREGGCEVQDFKDITQDLWPQDAAPQKDYMVYEILRRWVAVGKIQFNTQSVPSTHVGGLKGPRFMATLAA